MANSSSDLSPFMPEHELVELLWEDGQIVMQGQSNRTKKSSLVTELCFNGRFEDNGCGDEVTVVKFGQTGAADSATAHDLLRSVPSAMNSHEDDTAHWMNYPIQNDYCSEFFSEITDDMPSLSNTSSSLNPADKIAGFGQLARDSHGFRSSPVAPEPNKSSRLNHLFGMQQQCQIFSENAKTRVLDLDSSTHNHNNNHSSSSKRFPKHDAGVQKTSQKATSAGLLNFSHFSRPAALVKANLQSIERLHEKSSSSAARTGAVESTLVDSGSNGKPMANRSSSSHCQNSSFAASVMNKGRNEAERASETVVASSSVCSGFSAGAASNDRKPKSKKRAREGEESGEQSDDLEDDSFAVKEHSSGRGTSGKRSRAAEVHNLSERRRRDRINEKMKALQELIPNCNKVDKASMLDEAIEYLKTLQLQVQMMSMGSGLCMNPMMLTAGMNVHHLRAPQMASFSPLGVGMGIGMGMGMGFGMGMIDLNGSPGLISVPPMPGGGQFSCPSVPGVPGLYRMPHSSPIHSLGMPAQRLPVSFSPQKALLNPWQVSDTTPSASQIKQKHCINLEPKGEASQAACHKDSQAELHGSRNMTVNIKGTAGTG